MKPARPSRTLVLLLAVALLAAAVGVLFEATGRAAAALELRDASTRASTSAATQAPPTDVVIVGVDDKTLDADADDARRSTARATRRSSSS